MARINLKMLPIQFPVDLPIHDEIKARKHKQKHPSKTMHSSSHSGSVRHNWFKASVSSTFVVVTCTSQL